jgi:hypothetical protein
MTKANQTMRALWLTSLLLVASCAGDATGEIDDASGALTQADYDCERSRRACLNVSDCDADTRYACDSELYACRASARAERARVRELCRAQRDDCELIATNDAERHACHIAEHECKLPVDPPEAICHVDALQCRWDANLVATDGGPPHASHASEHACHEEEKACKRALRLDRTALPVAPSCEPRYCAPHGRGPHGPGPHGPGPFPPGSAEHEACKREHDRVHAFCRAEREHCEAAAPSEAVHRACHEAEHDCVELGHLRPAHLPWPPCTPGTPGCAP